MQALALPQEKDGLDNCRERDPKPSRPNRWYRIWERSGYCDRQLDIPLPSSIMVYPTPLSSWTGSLQPGGNAQQEVEYIQSHFHSLVGRITALFARRIFLRHHHAVPKTRITSATPAIETATMAPGTITGDPTGDLSDVVAMFVTVGIYKRVEMSIVMPRTNTNSTRKDE